MGELNSVESLWAARQELPKAGNGQKVALWRVISGMEVGKESELSPGERAAGLRKLVNVFARVLRVEFLEWREKEKGRATNETEGRDVQANSLHNMRHVGAGEWKVCPGNGGTCVVACCLKKVPGFWFLVPG